MKAVNINWDVDIDEVYEVLDETPATVAAEIFGIPKDHYANMTTAERHEYAYDYFRHCPGALYDFLSLPEEVEIIPGVEEDEVAEYLSDVYGYCIKGFNLEH